MKILLLNPKLHAAHSAVETLKKRGVAVLMPANEIEAWQMLQLHGDSVDVALVHREGPDGKGEPGLIFINKFKGNPSYADLPFILTTDSWSDEQCASHQETPKGANAYLRAPFADGQLFELIEAVTGANLGLPRTDGAAASTAGVPAPPAPAGGTAAIEVPTADASIVIEGLSPDTAESPVSLAPDTGEVSIPTAETAISLAPDTAGIAAAEAGGEGVDEDAAQQMPYLFGESAKEREKAAEEFISSRPLGDAVVPGGAASSPDVETLKKYLFLREQDVAALSSQLKTAKDQIASLEDILRGERAKNVELEHTVQEQKQKIDDFEKEKAQVVENMQAEADDLKFQLRVKTDKARALDTKVRETIDNMENLKERVRADIRKIRIREKELENRLEVLKKDSEALITARENKIVELKRKLDLLEFNMDLLQDQYSKEKERSALLRDRLLKAGQAMRVAGGLLDEEDGGVGGGGTESKSGEKAS